MEISESFGEFLSQPLIEAFGDRIKETKVREGIISDDFGRYDYTVRKTWSYRYVAHRFLEKFTLRDRNLDYYFLMPVENWHKGQAMAHIGEIGTILDYSIPRGCFITMKYHIPEYHPLRNHDDGADTPTWTPLEVMIRKEIDGEKVSSLVEMFRKLPKKSKGHYDGMLGGHSNEFRRAKVAVDSMPTRDNLWGKFDTDPSVSVIPRNGKTIVVVRFLSFHDTSEYEKKRWTEAVKIPLEISNKGVQIILPEPDNILNAFNLMERIAKVLEPLKVDGEHTSQYMGGLTSYLAFEIAQKIHKPDEEIGFIDFLNYTLTVREVVKSMGAATPGKEFVHPLWYPLVNINPGGQDEISYNYSARHLDYYWDQFEKKYPK
jgi:hypothetical protein